MARCAYSGRTSGQDTCGRNSDRGLRASITSATETTSSLHYAQAAYLRHDPLHNLGHIENPECKASGVGRHHVSCGGS